MSAPHSPGPWRLAWRDDRREVLASDGGPVVKLGGITSSQEWDGIPVLEANERLITVAPELLEMLERIIDGHAADIGSQSEDDLRDARALIARVKGTP